jgi:hypothetical protein
VSRLRVPVVGLSWQAIGDALLLGFAATVFGEIRAAELVLLVGSYVLLAVIINGYDVRDSGLTDPTDRRASAVSRPTNPNRVPSFTIVGLGLRRLRFSNRV